MFPSTNVVMKEGEQRCVSTEDIFTFEFMISADDNEKVNVVACG